MTQDQLKELERLNERWANDPKTCPGSIKAEVISTEVMDLLPEVLAEIKTLQCGILGMHQSVASMELVRKGLEAERDAAQGACAEMMEVLTGLQRGIIVESTGDESCPVCLMSYCNSDKECDGEPIHADDCKLAHSLSTDCGKGWLSPEQANEYRTGVMRELRRIAREEWKPVVTALAQTLEHLNIMLGIDGRPLDYNDRVVINDAQHALAHAASLLKS